MRSKRRRVLQHQLIDLALPVGGRRRRAPVPHVRAPELSQKSRFIAGSVSSHLDAIVDRFVVALRRRARARRRTTRRDVDADAEPRSVSARNAAARAEDGTSRRISSENRTGRRAASSSMPSPLRSRRPSSASISRASSASARPSGRSGLNHGDVGRRHRPRDRIARAEEHLLAVLAAIDAVEIARRNASSRQPRLRPPSPPSALGAHAAPAGGTTARRHRARAQLEQPRLAALLDLLQRFVVVRAESRVSLKSSLRQGGRRRERDAHPDKEAAIRPAPCASSADCARTRPSLFSTNGPKPGKRMPMRARADPGRTAPET